MSSVLILLGVGLAGTSQFFARAVPQNTDQKQRASKQTKIGVIVGIFASILALAWFVYEMVTWRETWPMPLDSLEMLVLGLLAWVVEFWYYNSPKIAEKNGYQRAELRRLLGAVWSVYLLFTLPWLYYALSEQQARWPILVYAVGLLLSRLILVLGKNG